MGHQRAHTELAGELQGLQEVGTGRLDGRGIEARHDLAMEAEGVGLVAALMMLPRMCQGLLCARERVIQPLGEKVALGEECDQEGVRASPPRRLVESYGLCQ